MPLQGNADTSDSTDQETMSKTNELNIRQIDKYKMESTGAITKSSSPGILDHWNESGKGLYMLTVCWGIIEYDVLVADFIYPSVPEWIYKVLCQKKVLACELHANTSTID